jgi:hypothetical protein
MKGYKIFTNSTSSILNWIKYLKNKYPGSER